MSVYSSHAKLGPQSCAATQWTLLFLAFRSSSAIGAADALEQFCAAYRAPILAFVRARGYGMEDAEDLTQSFFEHLLQKNCLSSAHPAKGRFRIFLRTCVKNFLADQHDKARAKKRGGEYKHLSIDAASSDQLYQPELADYLTPDLVYDRCWVTELMKRAQARLADYYLQTGRRDIFEVLSLVTPREEVGLSILEASQRLGMTLEAAHSHLSSLRRQRNKFIRDEFSKTVESEEEIDDEIRDLLSIYSR